MTDIGIPTLIEDLDKALAAPIPQSLTGPTYQTLMISNSVPGVFVPRDKLRGIREALSLSVSPLPEEIAELCARLRHPNYFGQEGMRSEAATALERMARGEELLKEVLSKSYGQAAEFARERDEKAAALERMAREIAEKDRLREKAIAHYTAVIGDQAARIRELEAEVKRDREAFGRLTAAHHENVAKWRERISELEAERDAIQHNYNMSVEDMSE